MAVVQKASKRVSRQATELLGTALHQAGFVLKDENGALWVFDLDGRYLYGLFCILLLFRAGQASAAEVVARAVMESEVDYGLNDDVE